jgi:hypothetical protein
VLPVLVFRFAARGRESLWIEATSIATLLEYFYGHHYPFTLPLDFFLGKHITAYDD